MSGGTDAPEPLRTDHDVSAFDSGESTLDEWLKRRALANEVSGASRTFVTSAEGRVCGYYSLAAGSVIHAVATTRARRNMPDPVPAVLLGRLAVAQAWQGKGIGGDLLRDAAMRVAGAASTIGVRVLLVHAMSEPAKRFYERFGFRASTLDPMTLMVTVEEVKRVVGGASTS
ncbi:MAG TPA: GNAT family N-acetyltransferase [Caulobacteraceae bacterium]|nr:GNAT family N-acetyltransferase [Caulobacteraceae bacterium]